MTFKCFFITLLFFMFLIRFVFYTFYFFVFFIFFSRIFLNLFLSLEQQSVLYIFKYNIVIFFPTSSSNTYWSWFLFFYNIIIAGIRVFYFLFNFLISYIFNITYVIVAVVLLVYSREYLTRFPINIYFSIYINI